MKLIRPIEVTESNLTSNVAITETEWTAGTYTTGTERYVDTTLYEVIADPDTTDEPTAGVLVDPPSWLKVGQINQFKMFSGVLSEQTENTGTIEVTIDPDTVVNAVALFNLAGNTATVSMDDPVEGQVYTETKSLLDNSEVIDWYSYFFEPITKKSDLSFLALPAYGSATVTVTVDAGEDTAKVGEMVIGVQRDLGFTSYGTSVGIVDYSLKERDAFGGAIIKERSFSRRVEYEVAIETPKVSSVVNILASVRAKPIVYIGEEDQSSTIAYGYYRDFGITYSTPSISRCTIEVEGLV